MKRIVISEKELKTSAFADDTTIYIGNNSSITRLEMRLMHLEKGTGIKYNKTKYKGKWLGFNKGHSGKPQGLKWNSDAIKILGKTYGRNIN